MSSFTFRHRVLRAALALAALLALAAPLAHAQGAPAALTDSLRWDPGVRDRKSTRLNSSH